MSGHGDVCGKKLGGRKGCTERVVRGVRRKKVGGRVGNWRIGKSEEGKVERYMNDRHKC